jgi:hypothetical protein
MRYLFTCSLLLLATSAFAQAKLNLPLKRELDSIYVQDQKYRELMVGISNGKTDSLAKVLGLPKDQLFWHTYTSMARTDSTNLRRIEAIVKRYGYPGQSLVGTPTNEAVYNVIQHSNKIPQYLPQVKAAAETHEIPYRLYAQMLDRKLVGEGKKQLYGTQGGSYTILNKASGQRETTFYIWPIQNPIRVNKRRKRAGFPNTMEESAANMHIPYKPVTLEYVEELRRQSLAQ